MNPHAKFSEVRGGPPVELAVLARSSGQTCRRAESRTLGDSSLGAGGQKPTLSRKIACAQKTRHTTCAGVHQRLRAGCQLAMHCASSVGIGLTIHFSSLSGLHTHFVRGCLPCDGSGPFEWELPTQRGEAQRLRSGLQPCLRPGSVANLGVAPRVSGARWTEALGGPSAALGARPGERPGRQGGFSISAASAVKPRNLTAQVRSNPGA